jgi:hypothetical protein
MAKVKSRGWYQFADGYRAWFAGLGASEKKREIAKHGAIIRFTATD